MTESDVHEVFTTIEIAYLLGAVGRLLRMDLSPKDRLMYGDLRDRLARHLNLNADNREALELDRLDRLH